MKLFTLLIIGVFTLFSFVQASSGLPGAGATKQTDPDAPGSEAAEPRAVTFIEPGEHVAGEFLEGVSGHTFMFEARPLHAYSFDVEDGMQLDFLVLDAAGSTVFSTSTDTDDQSFGPGTVHWDCLDGGFYSLEVTPSQGSAATAYAFDLEEVQGWLVAESLTRYSEVDGNLDYPGDVDYFFFERSDDERVYEISARGDGELILFWVDMEEQAPGAMVRGEEVSMIENYPGGGIASSDSYYGISGPEGTFRVKGEEKSGGGMSTWMIVGIVAGVVAIVLTIVAITSLKDSCDSCNSPFGIGNENNIGCSGN
jgi:hypothetical protein